MKRVAVLLTCHNRKTATLACIGTLTANRLPDGVKIHVILVDDGSTDGTATAVSERYPTVEILPGDGNLYWNGGMCKAFGKALEEGYDFYLWLNDDTILEPGAIGSMIETWYAILDQRGDQAIVVGSTKNRDTGRTTYGGISRPITWRRTTFTVVEPNEKPKECETMNGNCVLIPHEIATVVGNLDPRFVHAMGDIDYGLRARQAGFTVWIAPGYVGTCSHNSIEGGFKDRSLSLKSRLQKMAQPKGLPPASWRIFTKRHTGRFWFLFWLWPYLRVVVESIRPAKIEAER
jgi:GT2 family glycosyltransferase